MIKNNQIIGKGNKINKKKEESKKNIFNLDKIEYNYNYLTCLSTSSINSTIFWSVVPA